MRKPKRFRSRREIRGAVSDDDPLNGVANLFDLGMVFAVAMLLATLSFYSLPELIDSKKDVTLVKNPGQPNMEIIRKQGLKVERLRLTQQEIGGEGERLGTAYRLKSGEVVYIPESRAGAAQDAPKPTK